MCYTDACYYSSTLDISPAAYSTGIEAAVRNVRSTQSEQSGSNIRTGKPVVPPKPTFLQHPHLKPNQQ